MASWIPQPLERTTLVVEWSDRFHAYAVNSHRSPLSTLYPRISLCHQTTLGYYPKPIPSRTSRPSWSMWTQGARPAVQKVVLTVGYQVGILVASDVVPGTRPHTPQLPFFK